MRVRLLGFVLAISGLLLGQTHKPVHPSGPSALDKKQFEFYVRHLFVWPAAIQVQISDPKPSSIPGFYEVHVLGSQGNASQQELFFVSKDGKQIIRGSVYEVKNNPFRDQLSKIQTRGRPSFGTAGAPVVIAEFSDFQCHYCKEEAKLFRENLLKDYPTQVRFFFMDYPLEGLHPWARAAAIAGQCVYRQSEAAFWDYHDWMFEHQEEITPENLTEKMLGWAKDKPLKGDALSTCIATKATDAEVTRTVAMGHALSINSTPTSFINGRPMVGATPWADLKSVIDFEIGYQETAKDAGENCGCDLGLPKLGVN